MKSGRSLVLLGYQSSKRDQVAQHLLCAVGWCPTLRKVQLTFIAFLSAQGIIASSSPEALSAVSYAVLGGSLGCID
nr:unnamed protein product [Haemonchus contortus]